MNLNSKFDVQTIDSPIATAALELCLDVANPPSPSYNTNGTPVPGTIFPGMIVTQNTAGKIVLATAPDKASAEPILVFIAFDGNTDFGGALVQNVTCLQGGFTIVTDQYNAGSFLPGQSLTFSGGKFSAISGALDTHQRYGWVGPKGLDAVNGILHVILPQGNQ